MAGAGQAETVVHQLGIEPHLVEWFADRRGYERYASEEALRHYHYRWEAKRSGGVRLIEAPKPRLKEIQRILLRRVLDRVPPHSAAHGFRRGRSIRTATGPHIRKHTVLRMDLRDFFGSILARRVRAMFFGLGYDRDIACWLTGLCTHRTPDWVFDEHCDFDFDVAARGRARVRYQRVHLPQGAPSSPAIANLCAWRLDVRLATLADAVRADYTRYGDDLLFSGDEAFGRAVRRFQARVGAIVAEEGFAVEQRKTRVMRQSTRQSGLGVILNQRANIARPDFDRLKAILFNCRKTGAEAQNHSRHPDFRAHLSGKVAHVEAIHPERGARLRAMLQEIDWQE